MIQQMCRKCRCVDGCGKTTHFENEEKLFYLHTHNLFSPCVTALGARPMCRKSSTHVEVASKHEGTHHDPTEGRRMTYGQKATPTQNLLYLIGQCIDCGNRRQSPGRPRCNECHSILLSELMSRG